MPWQLEGYSLQLSAKGRSGYSNVGHATSGNWVAQIWKPEYVHLGTHATPELAALAVAKYHAQTAQTEEEEEAEEKEEGEEEDDEEEEDNEAEAQEEAEGFRLQLSSQMPSGYRGVTKKASGRYRARALGQHVGTFDTALEAAVALARAANQAAKAPRLEHGKEEEEEEDEEEDEEEAEVAAAEPTAEHKRPRGRPPKGKVWNGATGRWDALQTTPTAAPSAEASVEGEPGHGKGAEAVEVPPKQARATHGEGADMEAATAATALVAPAAPATMCGTFGCVLPDRHAGLHHVPTDGAARKRRASMLKLPS